MKTLEEGEEFTGQCVTGKYEGRNTRYRKNNIVFTPHPQDLVAVVGS